MGDQNPQDFAEKVLQSLKKSSRAVDLNDKPEEASVEASVEAVVEAKSDFSQQAVSRDFTAYGSVPQGGQGPGTGGNKDLVIIPGFTGAAATSVSQINLYWNAPNTPDSTGVDTNIRTTIYNYAINPGAGVTTPVIVFGGYNGTQQFKPHPLYGGGTGVTAKIWMNPFLGQIDTDYIGFNATGIAATSDAGVMSWDNTQLKIRVGTGSGTAKTVAFTDDVQAASGLATTATNIHLAAGANNAAHYLAFSLTATGAGVALSSDTDLSYNPSANTLTAVTFAGALTGTATTATNIHIAAATTSATHYLHFSPNASGVGIATSTDTDLTYNPSTNVLTVGSVSGNVTGNLTGNVTGFATTAQNVNVAAATTAATHYITFTPAATGAGLAVSTDTDLSYNPSTNVLTATTFSGALTGNVTGNLTGNVTGFATTAQNLNTVAATANVTHYVLFSNVNGGSGVAVSTDAQLTYNPSTDTLAATTFSGALTGNVTGNLTGNVTGTATTAQNIHIAAATTSSSHFIHFSPTATGVGIATSTDTDLTYNPSTNVLTVGSVSGNLTGNVTGFATTAQNINAVSAATNATHYLLFSPVNGASGVAVSTDTQLTYNPSTDTLSATTFSGSFTGTITGTATTAASVNVNASTANATHYILISPSASGTGIGLSTDSTFTINASNNALSIGTGNLTANGVVVGSASNTINTSSGNLTIDSNGGTTNITDNVIVTGNLTVQGTTITVDSTISTIVDPIIVIGSGAGGTHSTLDDNKDRGIEFRWSNSGTATTGFFGFDDSTGKFTFIPNGANTNEVFSGSAGTALFGAVEAVLVGNAVGTAATFTNFYGTLIGNVTGNLTGFATTAQNINVVAASTNATHYIAFTTAASGSGLATSTDAELTYNPSTNVLSATTFSGAFTGNVTGTATTAQNINVAAATTSATHYLTFTPAATGSGLAVSTDTDLSYNPSTNVLTVTTVSGNVTGNLTGNVTGFATTAQNLNVVAASTNATHYVTFSPSTSGSGVAVSTDAQLTYNPSTDTLSATTFSGALTGNVTGNLTGNVTGTATTAQNLHVAAASTNATHYVTFSPSTSGSGVAVSTDAQLTYNPSTDTLSATTFSGALTGNVTGNLTGSVTGTATTAQNLHVAAAATNATHYITFSPAATGSGLATSTDAELTYNPSTNILTATTFSGAFTGNLTGFATTAQNLNIAAATTSATHYLTFTPAATGSGLAVSTDTDLSYNPSTNILTATTFSGALTGNAATATTAANLNVVTTTAAGSHYLLFSPTNGGSGIAVSIDSTLTYVPSTDTISVTNISPTTITSSSALTNGTYLTVKTNASDDSSTTDFFIRGLTSADVSKFSVDANGNLRATTKSFDIPHPTKDGMRLVYGVLEGPEHGVYHRGTVEGKGNLLIELPDYWSELVNEDFTVSLTPHGNYGVHIVEKSLNSFIIALSGNFLSKKLKTIKVDYLVHGSRKDAPLIIEQPA